MLFEIKTKPVCVLIPSNFSRRPRPTRKLEVFQLVQRMDNSKGLGHGTGREILEEGRFKIDTALAMLNTVCRLYEGRDYHHHRRN